MIETDHKETSNGTNIVLGAVPEKPKTLYAMYWAEFKKTNEYTSCLEAMILKGHKQPYIDNILRTAFDAGYNCPKV